MAQDKTHGPFGEDLLFESNTPGTGSEDSAVHAYTTIDRLPPSSQVMTPPGSYEDRPDSDHHYIEGSLDSALVFLGDEVVDSSSVNLRIMSDDSTFLDSPTRLSSSEFAHEVSLPPDEQTSVRQSGVPAAVQQSGRQVPVGQQLGIQPNMRGSQVRNAVADHKSGPVPIGVDRLTSQPAPQPGYGQVAPVKNSLEPVNCDAADPELPPGARLGNYEIVRKIGQGGMGVVYEARHLLLPRRVAIKFLLINKSHDEEQIRRFLGEAVASAQIGHKGVVDIYDYGYDERNLAYLVMELVDGQSLQNVMKRSGQLPVAMSIRIVHDVAEILASAHHSGIVHRDLKPDNILLSRDEFGKDFTKILDFGVAKFVNAQSMSGKTKIGSILGTPWYMPPEQCQGFLTVDYRSDIYALGCVFYQMVCGKVPFSGILRDVLMAHIHVDPQPPRNLCPAIPPRVEALILQMMAKEPTDRPSSMGEIASSLAKFLDDAPARDPANRAGSPQASNGTQNRWLAPLLAAVLAGLATSAAFYFLQG